MLVERTGEMFSGIEANYSGGKTRHFEVRKTPIRSTIGDIVGTQVMFWDVSDYKQAVAELDRERQLLNALLANTPDNIYFKDMGGRFIRISRAQAKFLGINDPADAVEQSPGQAVHRELLRYPDRGRGGPQRVGCQVRRRGYGKHAGDRGTMSLTSLRISFVQINLICHIFLKM